MLDVGKVSCFEVPGGRHRAVTQVRDNLGKPFTLKREGKTPAIAKKRLEEAVRSYTRCQPSIDMSVSAMCEAFLARCAEKGRAPKTIADYKGIKTGIVDPSIGHLKVKDLKAFHVEEMIANLPDKRAINARAFLRAAINKVARKADSNLPNVAEFAEPPSYKKRQAVQLLEQNFLTTLDHEPDLAKKAFFLFLADTGLRPTEARNLTWFEIHHREDGVWIQLAESKTDEGLNPIPVSKLVAAAIANLPRSSTYVWPSSAPRSKGKPYHEKTWRLYWEDAQRRADVPITTLYEIRHFFGSMMARKVRDTILARLMHHTDVRTTKQYYVRAFDEDLRAAKE